MMEEGSGMLHTFSGGSTVKLLHSVVNDADGEKCQKDPRQNNSLRLEGGRRSGLGTIGESSHEEAGMPHTCTVKPATMVSIWLM